MAERNGQTWLLEEYLIVGDLWLRTGRSVGTGSSEVKEVAALLGRSPGSISYRVGNFAGTDQPGSGLKPLTGEPLAQWLAIRGNLSELKKAVEKARAKMRLITGTEAAAGEGAASGLVSVISAEQPGTEPLVVNTAEGANFAVQNESILRKAFHSWLDPKGQRLRGIEIKTGSSRLRVDLFDTVTNVLIEVKAAATRDLLRLAVGQLYDYRRYLSFDVRLAVLVPNQPSMDLMGLLEAADVSAIWAVGTAFEDSSSGVLVK